MFNIDIFGELKIWREERSQSSAFWHTKLYDTVTDAINELYRNAKLS